MECTPRVFSSADSTVFIAGNRYRGSDDLAASPPGGSFSELRAGFSQFSGSIYVLANAWSGQVQSIYNVVDQVNRLQADVIPERWETAFRSGAGVSFGGGKLSREDQRTYYTPFADGHSIQAFLRFKNTSSTSPLKIEIPKFEFVAA